MPLGLDELVDHWTVTDDEWKLVAEQRGPTRLGFVLLLKFSTQHGRFPAGRSELPDEAVEFATAVSPETGGSGPEVPAAARGLRSGISWPRRTRRCTRLSWQQPTGCDADGGDNPPSASTAASRTFTIAARAPSSRIPHGKWFL
jgi:hypothetical protein